jgi:hypothetical protein
VSSSKVPLGDEEPVHTTVPMNLRNMMPWLRLATTCCAGAVLQVLVTIGGAVDFFP